MVKKIINRAAMSRARFMVYPLILPFFRSFCVERPKLPLGHVVSWTSNHATYVYSPKVVETFIHTKKVMDTVFFIVCKIFFWIYRSVGFEGSNKWAEKKVLRQPWNALALQLSLSRRDK